MCIWRACFHDHVLLNDGKSDGGFPSWWRRDWSFSTPGSSGRDVWCESYLDRSLSTWQVGLWHRLLAIWFTVHLAGWSVTQITGSLSTWQVGLWHRLLVHCPLGRLVCDTDYWLSGSLSTWQVGLWHRLLVHCLLGRLVCDTDYWFTVHLAGWSVTHYSLSVHLVCDTLQFICPLGRLVCDTDYWFTVHLAGWSDTDYWLSGSLSTWQVSLWHRLLAIWFIGHLAGWSVTQITGYLVHWPLGRLVCDTDYWLSGSLAR